MTVAEIRNELQKVEDAIDAAYWRFCRCARADPPAHELYVKRNELRTQLRRRCPHGGRGKK